MATEDINRMIHAMEQMNTRINTLQDELQNMRNTGREDKLIDRYIKPETFNGNNYHAWAEDFMSIVTTRKANYADAMKWAENKRDQTISMEEATRNTGITEENIRELYVYLLHHLSGEPRIIAKASGNNGIDAWRRLKNRHDPITEVSQVSFMMQALQPPRSTT